MNILKLNIKHACLFQLFNHKIMKLTSYVLFLICLINMHQTRAQGSIKNINAFDDNGKTALINAVSKKNVDEVKSLINNGANINLSEAKGLQGTPLMYAASTGNKVLCQLLINKGANVNLLDVNKDHALNWATFYGHVGAMKFLIQSGADLNVKSKHGAAVDVALRMWHQDSVVNVFRTTKLAQPLTKNEKKFITAVKKGNYKALKKFIKRGVSPNLKDNVGIPLLQIASQTGNKKMVEFLVSNGADVNCTNRVGQTPLAWASRFGHLAVVKLLIELGADTNKTDKKYQLTPLIGTAVRGSVSTAKELIINGAKINHRDIINNATAIHWAIFYGHQKFAKALIELGADYHTKALENDKYSGYQLAKIYKQKALLEYMDSLDATKKKRKLLGSWKVQEIHYQYSDSTYIMKDEDHGRFLFSENNYVVMYNPRMQKRKPFKNLSKPDSYEVKDAFTSIVFNTGSYVLKDSIIITTADIAKVPGFEGGKQFYTMNLSNNNLELIMYDETYPSGEKPEWLGKLKIKFILKKE